MKLAKNSFQVAVMILLLSLSVVSQKGPEFGHWSLVLETTKSYLPFTVDIGGDAEHISAIVLRGGLNVSHSVFEDGQLVMNGYFRSDPITIRVTVTGPKMNGTWQAGESTGKVYGEFQPYAARMKAFDEIIKTTSEYFYSPLFNGADWQAVGKRYRKEVEKIDNDGQFYRLINKMLGELKSSHVGFYFSEANIFSEPLPAKNSVQKKTATSEEKIVSWKKIGSNVGYLRISSFAEGEEYVKDIDKAFADIGELPSLVIDLRGNEGGTLSIAMRLGDYIFLNPQSLGVLATRKGLTANKADSIDKLDPNALPKYSGYNVEGFLEILREHGAVILVTGGRAEKPYRGKIVVLTDENSASASEGFISAIKETRAATIIGRRTEGALLSSRNFDIAGGWTLKLPEADFCTPKGFRPEVVGIEPDIEVKKIDGKDADIERALQFLKENR